MNTLVCRPNECAVFNVISIEYGRSSIKRGFSGHKVTVEESRDKVGKRIEETTNVKKQSEENKAIPPKVN